MLQNKSLAEDVELLLRAKEWRVLKAWFGQYTTEDELIDKIILWGKTFLPHYLRDETPPFHRELIRKLLSDKNEYTACPRGFAKTTLNQLVVSYMVAYQLKNFIVIIEKSFTEASEVIFAVTEEFRTNALIRQVYGILIRKNFAGWVDDKSKDAQGDVFINGVRLRAKGFNTPIRGLKSKEWRPDLILVDDVEEDTHIGNDEQRRKYRENFAQGIVPSVDIGGTIKVTGTILHFDSLLKNLIDQYAGTIYRAFDKNNPEETLLWADRWTYERLMQKKADMEMEGKGSSKFFQEYLNDPTDDDTRAFKEDWLEKEHSEADTKFRVLNRYITIDVAESKKDGADYTGVVVVDWDSENNWFVQYARRYKINVTELVNEIFVLWERFKPLKIGVEKKAFEDQIKPLLKMKSEETGIFPVVVELEHGGKRKEDRIRGALVGRFEAGKIYFKRAGGDDQRILKGELYDFPHSKNDDLGDALAYVEQIGVRPLGLGVMSKVKSSIEREFETFKRGRFKSLAQRL